MKTALLVVDVQVEMFSDTKTPVYKGQEMLDNIEVLIRKAHDTNTPIIYIKHTQSDDKPMAKGKPGWEVHPQIAPAVGDAVVLKTTPSSFYKTNLQELLSSMGIVKIVVTGLQTECCIDTTVRHAFSLGYEVVLVRDANSTYDIPPLTAPQIIQHHHRIIGNWFAQIQSTDEVEFVKAIT